jgi:hypothetical protein
LHFAKTIYSSSFTQTNTSLLKQSSPPHAIIKELTAYKNAVQLDALKPLRAALSGSSVTEMGKYHAPINL